MAINIDVRGGYCGECGHALLFGACPGHGNRLPLAARYVVDTVPRKPARIDGRTIVGRKRRGITATS